MQSVSTIRIKASRDAVWKVLADDFAAADQWMAVVHKSYDVDNEHDPKLGGRVCELSTKDGGPEVIEAVHGYDKENYVFSFRVFPRGSAAKLPIFYNDIFVKLYSVDSENTKVIWQATPKLKPWGYAVYPVIKVGLGMTFGKVLEELQHFAETGKPHPRKVRALQAQKS